MNLKPTTIAEYISGFPKEIQLILEQIRSIIKKAAPQSVESISYGMPAFKTNGMPLVYFAAYKNHIGFYATASGHEKFANELSNYKHAKGSVQFPIDQAIPFELIKQIIEFKVLVNNQKQTLKK